MLINLQSLFARGQIDLLANFDIAQNFVPEQSLNQEGFELRNLSFPITFEDYLHSLYTPDVRKVLIMGWIIPEFHLSKIPKEKLVFFLWEPGKMLSSYYERFSRVYTWDDSLVDNIKFFKLYYPALLPMRSDIPSFEEKKFCAMFVRNWTQKRIKLVNFFGKNSENDLDIYGAKSGTIYDNRLYRGSVPGPPNSEEKHSILKNYRFCVCFENSCNFKGYISEKIFSCFASGCIPIYLGATNIEEYIPKDCFIDYRDFQNDVQLYQFLKLMRKETYERYLSNIRAFLQSDRGQIFSKEYLDKLLYEAVIQ